MSYKFSLGERTFDDITAEVDAQANTKIDFEEDYIGLVTSGSSTLVVSGSRVGIGTAIPDHLLTLNAAADGDGCFIQFKEGEADRAKIGINTSNNLLFHNQFTNKHIVFKVNDQGQTREGLRIDGAVPEVVVNEGSESLVDFRVESDNNTHMLFVDGANDKVGINTDQPDYTLDVAGDIGVDENIYHNGDPDTLIQFANDKIVLKAGNRALITAEINNVQPHEVTINDGANNVDFVVKGNGSGAGNPGMKFDASTNRLGINGVGSPEVALDIDSDAIRIRNDNTPSSASDFGHKGEIRWDSNYLYICVATDTWKRVALSSW